MKKLLLLLPVIFLGGCALVQNSTGSEEFTKQLRESFGKSSVSETQGTMPMVGVNRTYNVRSGGDVTITPGSQDNEEVENIIKNLKAELIEAQSKLKTTQKSTEDLRASMESSESYHRKWHVVSGIAVLLFAIAALLGVFAISRFRNEISKWGFDPSSIGRVANSLVGTIKEAAIDVNEELNYVNRRIAENGVSNDAKSELLRQRDVLKSAKARYETVSNSIQNRII